MVLPLIERTDVIEGAENDEFHPDGLVHCTITNPARFNHTLNRSAVHGLTSPVGIVGGRAGIKRIVVLGVYYSKATGAYAGGAAVAVHFSDPATTSIATIPATVLRNAAAVTGWAERATLAGSPESQPLVVGGIQLSTATAYTGAGGNLTVSVIFLEVEE